MTTYDYEIRYDNGTQATHIKGCEGRMNLEGMAHGRFNILNTPRGRILINTEHVTTIEEIIVDDGKD